MRVRCEYSRGPYHHHLASRASRAARAMVTHCSHIYHVLRGLTPLAKPHLSLPAPMRLPPQFPLPLLLVAQPAREDDEDDEEDKEEDDGRACLVGKQSVVEVGATQLEQVARTGAAGGDVAGVVRLQLSDGEQARAGGCKQADAGCRWDGSSPDDDGSSPDDHCGRGRWGPNSSKGTGAALHLHCAVRSGVADESGSQGAAQCRASAEREGGKGQGEVGWGEAEMVQVGSLLHQLHLHRARAQVFTNAVRMPTGAAVLVDVHCVCAD